MTIIDIVDVECSSQAEDHPASNLRTFDEEGDGWLSSPDGGFPQSLTLSLPSRCHVETLDILSNQAKIAESVEIYLGDRSSETIGEDDDVFNLGYITFDRNDQSDYQARELKSVPIGQACQFLRLVFTSCHANSAQNPLHQVGIVGVRVLGVAIKADNDQGDMLVDSTSIAVPERISVPVSVESAAQRQPPPAASLPAHIKAELEPRVAGQVDRLERLKRERASVEDYDGAFAIKNSLTTRVYPLLISFKECEQQMKSAAQEEDYAKAAKLKIDRDAKRSQAIQALDFVEEEFAPSALGKVVGDLSISTIKDTSVISQRSPSRSLHGMTDEVLPLSRMTDSVRSIRSPPRSVLSSNRHYEESNDMSDEESSRSIASCGDDEPSVHPLAGVENAEELPAPEDISSGAASSDLVNKVEELFGDYVTRCLFSQNWVLRDAALCKMTFSLSTQAISDDGGGALFRIIEFGIVDKNQQVYLSALVLLSSTLAQTERAPTNHISRIVSQLLQKLSDSSRKVVEGSEIALLSLANFECVDLSQIVNSSLRKIKSKESKGGRAVKARLEWLDKLAVETHSQAMDVPWSRLLEFAKASRAFDHKDAAVRDAAKSLAITLSVIHGESVLQSLKSWPVSLRVCDGLISRHLELTKCKH